MSTIPNPPSQRQIMASFAYMAYCGQLITTPYPEPQILSYINAAMPQIPPIAPPNPTWSVVWGPSAYTVPGALYQDNMMYVVQNQSDKTQYAIAIRGTNRTSDLDWLLEDFDVLQTIIWPPGAGAPNPAGAMISESTSVDLQIVLAMQAAAPGGGGNSLIAFLKSQTSTAINLCVTGHSLGGCLAGTLALYLKENQPTWDASGKSIVSCVTFAAPTAGNAAFAAYSDSQFSGGPYPPGWDTSLGTTCDAVRCTYDVAPLAWIAGNFSVAVTPPKIPPNPPLFQTYEPNLKFDSPPLDFSSGIGWAFIKQYFLPLLAGKLTDQNYAQIVNGAAQLSGVYNSNLAPTDTSLITYLEAFVAQAAYQHSASYPTALGVPQLLDPNIIKTV